MERGKTMLAVAIASWAVGVPSCSIGESPPPVHESAREGPMKTRTHELSDPGIEKLIPLRFINLKSCEPGPGCPDNASYYDILRDVDAANEVFKAAGVQFWPKSIERYHTPTLADVAKHADCGGNGDVTARWDVIRSELLLPFPNMPLNAWTDATEKTTRIWMRSANTVYSNPEEMIVWIVERNSCSGSNNGANPFEGRNVFCQGSLMDEPYKFTHELGHCFGLSHPWDSDPWPDPQTMQPSLLEDRWDLVYKPGTSDQDPHLFFTSWDDAHAYHAALQLIETGNGGDTDSCGIDADGVVHCDVPPCTQPCYTKTYWTGDDELKGLAFTFPNGQAGANIMTYMNLGGQDSMALSDSQIEKVRKFLRWAVQVNQDDTERIGDGFNFGTIFSARVPRLGSWNLRQVGAKLDFDLDGKRDIGVWEPPTAAGLDGRFTVLLSSKGFSTSPGQYMSVQLGQLGDVPVPADFSGDGRTDLAVYQPGGGQNRSDPTDTLGWWRWCPTAAAAETTACTANPPSTQWGHRDEVPLPGLSFNGLTSVPQATYFSPNQGGKWSFRAVSGGLATTRYLGGPGSVPLPGDYDGDFLADIAVYNSDTAEFKLLRSQQSWSNPPLVGAFGAKFVPSDSGSAMDRSGAIPLSGMYRPRTICTPFCLTYPRRVFSLWFPYDGTWTTMWDPLNSVTTDTCQWGVGRLDMPITNIDRNGDYYSDMAVYRGPGWSDPGWFHFKRSTPAVPNSCTGSINSVYYSNGSRIRQRVVGVADMTGDGKAEILLVNPDFGTIQWMTSESGYTTVNSRSVGSQRAIVL